MTYLSFPADFIDNVRFSMNSGVLPYCLFLLMCTFGTIWEWKSDIPKGERFWGILGIFLLIITMMVYSALNLMSDLGMIRKFVEKLLKAINLIFAYISFGFICRLLTQHWIKNLWIYTSIAFPLCAILVYVIRTYLG